MTVKTMKAATIYQHEKTARWYTTPEAVKGEICCVKVNGVLFKRAQTELGDVDNFKQQLSGALARAYCTKENESKVLDPTLIFAMEKEILALLPNPPQEKGDEV